MSVLTEIRNTIFRKTIQIKFPKTSVLARQLVIFMHKMFVLIFCCKKKKKSYIRFFSLSQLYLLVRGFPGGPSGKEHACQCRKCKTCRFDPWVRKISWRKAWHLTLVFLPGQSHRLRSIGSQRVTTEAMYHTSTHILVQVKKIVHWANEEIPTTYDYLINRNVF